MPYRLKRNESLAAGIQRIATEQIDKGLGELEDAALGPHETVHQVRKRCKKIRAVVRLVRPVMQDTYRTENAWYRDTAKTVSQVRDAEAVIETFDALLEVFADQVDEAAFAAARQTLVDRKRALARDEVDLEGRIDELRRRFAAGRQRVAAWPIDEEGFAGLAGGLEKTYRRARKGLRAAYAEATPEAFHEWRKRVKYHWYHMRVLRNVWRPVIGARRDELGELADLLGDDHDLAVLRAAAAGDPRDLGGDRDVAALLALVDRRRDELQRRAAPLGARVFAEKPGAFVARLAEYWKVWK